MKNNSLKSIIGITALGFFIMAWSPANAQSQNDKRNTKVVVVKNSTPIKHYNKKPRRGAQVKSLPKKTVVVSHYNRNYHYRDGIFYRPVNGSYVVAAPPIGIRVAQLPAKSYRINISGRPYYYYYGSYYAPGTTGDYEVVSAPLGARIDALPEGYEVFELDGMVFYKLDEVFYKAAIEPNGSVVYEVVRV